MCHINGTVYFCVQERHTRNCEPEGVVPLADLGANNYSRGMTSERNRIIRLFDKGFYPVELPPPFTTRGLSEVRGSFSPPANYAGSTTFFDGATFRGPLRTFGVINPANYALLSRYLAENWPNITEVYRLSGSSGARPKFPALSTSGRAIETASLAVKRKSQRHLASVYPVILSLDINRFYGSIYTHSIPWSVLGKQEAKRRYANGTLSGHWSDKLDKLTRNCNQRQTIGLPIGPDTSRVISELILSRVDAELTASGLVTPQIYHNIDDYQIGCLGTGEAEDAQSRFVRTISRYELRLNDFKTSVSQGLSFTPSNFQRHFDYLGEQVGANFVEHFFEILYAQAPLHPNTNVIGYALKRFARRLARNAERDLVREYLQRLIFAAPHQARWIMPILLGIYRASGANAEMRRLVAWGVETCARRNDVGSLLWYLYAAVFLRIRLRSELCAQCFGMSNELVDLMLLHGRSETLFSVHATEMRRRYRSSDFRSAAWLPLYEAGRRGWETSPAFSKIGTAADEGGLYQHLSDNNVEFYITDPDRFDVEAFDGWELTQHHFDDDAGEIEEWELGMNHFERDRHENYV